MKHRSPTQHRIALAICALGFGLLTTNAMAANNADRFTTDINAQYQQDLQLCQTKQSAEDRATCRQEAGAARQAALKHKLVVDSPDALAANARTRCQALPANQREACLLQMSPNSNTRIQGSVDGGGLLRITEITIPGRTETETTIITPNVIDPALRELPKASAVK